MPKTRIAEFEVVSRPDAKKTVLALTHFACLIAIAVACAYVTQWEKVPLILGYSWFACGWYLLAAATVLVANVVLVGVLRFLFRIPKPIKVSGADWGIGFVLFTLVWFAFMTREQEYPFPAFRDSRNNVVVFSPDDVPYTAGGNVADRIRKVDDTAYLKNDANDLLALVPLPVVSGRFAKVETAAKERFAITTAADLSGKLVGERSSPGAKAVQEKR